MAPNILNILVFFTVGVVASHAAAIQAPQLYWKSKLPNTPMPKSLISILPSGYEMMEEKSTSVGVSKGGVSVDAGKGKPGGTSVGVSKGGVNVDAGKGKPGGTSVSVGKGGVNVNAGGKGKPASGKGKGTKVGVGKGGVSVSTGGKGKPVYVGVKPGPSPFIYNYAASETQLHDNPDVALFFLEKDLHAGSQMNLHFTAADREATFVPRQVAQSVPFSSTQLPQILSRFSVSPGSLEAQLMEKTIKECEEEGIKGEDKYCATSLESMIDFTTAKLGTKVNAVSTQVEKVEPIKQKYTVRGGVKKMRGDKAVVCHKQEYVYAVFYCHTTETTKAYMVPLEGADGTKANAVAVCHTDTSAWNPKHLAFQVLKIKPGTSSVCHFLPQNHLVWLPNN